MKKQKSFALGFLVTASLISVESWAQTSSEQSTAGLLDSGQTCSQAVQELKLPEFIRSVRPDRKRLSIRSACQYSGTKNTIGRLNLQQLSCIQATKAELEKLFTMDETAQQFRLLDITNIGITLVDNSMAAREDVNTDAKASIQSFRTSLSREGRPTEQSPVSNLVTPSAKTATHTESNWVNQFVLQYSPKQRCYTLQGACKFTLPADLAVSSGHSFDALEFLDSALEKHFNLPESKIKVAKTDTMSLNSPLQVSTQVTSTSSYIAEVTDRALMLEVVLNSAGKCVSHKHLDLSDYLDRESALLQKYRRQLPGPQAAGSTFTTGARQ